MAKKRVLFISQEVTPYLPAGEMSTFGKTLAQGLHQNGCEVRIFMPNYGLVNERRNQLHEVIRLSGLNIVISDNDHPLIIKVASLQPSRIQAYFTDNDDYFQKDAGDADAVGSNRADNDERTIFFAHGTAETIKKLRWEPEVIHCAGWITSLVPLYMRSLMPDDSQFDATKIIYEVLPGEISTTLNPAIFEKLNVAGLKSKTIDDLKTDTPSTQTLHLLGIANSDGVIFHGTPDAALLKEVETRNLPYIVLPELGEAPEIPAYKDFYNKLAGNA